MIQEYSTKQTTQQQHTHALKRGQPLKFAFILHRLSGLLLALFLPAHFWVLSLVIFDKYRLTLFLEVTQLPIVKLAETILVSLLAVHFFGGLRLMAFESFSWPSHQKTTAAAALSMAIFIAMLFFLRTI